MPGSVAAATALAATSDTEWTGDGLTDRPLRHAIEVRHPSFLNTAFIQLLRDHNVAVVFTNTPGAPGFRDLTGDFVYVRLGSGEDHYPDGYDDAALDEWAGRIDAWRDGGRDVFVYFKNPAGLLPHTPHNATRLIERLG